jgi:PleD family two-component response regulator
MTESGLVNVLIIDDDRGSQLAIGHVLDSEGWRMRAVALPERALAELATGEWTVVIANLALTGLAGPLFETLKELSLAEAITENKKHRVRVLFLIPEMLAGEGQPALEQHGLPYALKPLNLNDFLEKVSDLMLEVRAIPEPLRKVKQVRKERRRTDRRAGRDRRHVEMFAGREDYSMGEEEYAEYEKEVREKEREEERKRAEARKSLGEPPKD